MLAAIESFFHRLRRRFSRTEWAVRQFHRPVAADADEEPGLLLIHVDGLSQAEFESPAVTACLPVLHGHRERERVTLHPFASAAGDTPGSYPGFEPEPVWQRMRGRPGARLGYALLHLPTLLRLAGAWVSASARAIGRAPARPPETLREAWIVLGARIDLARGIPLIRVRLAALRAAGVGQESPDPENPRRLRRLDRTVDGLFRAARRSRRRDYQVWIVASPPDAASRGFLLTPAESLAPPARERVLSPSDLREAARALIEKKHAPYLLPSRTGEGLRIMSYNVHRCLGMDGRLSPRRIARVIAREAPDIVALQEIDRGTGRSRGEDQAAVIAGHLGYHYVFCPTVSHPTGVFGHALLSRWKIEPEKIDLLPGRPGGVWPEPRGAILARISADSFVVQVLSTHLGLSAAERILQMQAVLGSAWLDSRWENDPVILCGDLNLTPGSPAHRMASTHLRDVAHAISRGVPTFSTMRLVAQLDHIFVSSRLHPEAVHAVRNELTRRASDHLPLMAHLRVIGK